jgi:MFS family permease
MYVYANSIHTAAFNIIMWGIVLSCFAAVENYAGAIAIRFFLGVFESAVTPGFALFTSQWYTKKEQGARTGIWFSFNGWAQIFGGCLAYGIAVGCRKTGTTIEPWKIVFLATGLLTTALGFLFLWIVPDNQMNCRWLSKEERVLAIERIRGNGQGVGNKHFKMYQLREALLDPLSWAFFFYALIADVPNGMCIFGRKSGRFGLMCCRWHFEFLLTAHRQLRIYARGIAPVRNTWGCSRSRFPHRVWMGRRQVRVPRSHLNDWTLHCDTRYGSHRRSTSE